MFGAKTLSFAGYALPAAKEAIVKIIPYRKGGPEVFLCWIPVEIANNHLEIFFFFLITVC